MRALWVAAVLCLSTLVAQAETLRIATFNVHYIIVRQAEGAWSLGDWERRKGPLDLAFKHVAADIIGFQEMESFAGRSVSTSNLALDWILARNPSYAAAAVGDPRVFPSTQPIFYRKDRFKLRDQGWFFFSETPDVIYSRTFNGSFPAFASWAQFERAGQRFRVVNLHTDFRSRSNRLKSMELVATRIRLWIAEGEPVFVIGDFNARAGAKTLRIIEAEGITFPPVPWSTYHFNRGLHLFGAIDHIGHTNGVRPKGAPVVVRRKFAGEWPTDNYPVYMDITLQP